jgi:hypothetical protein
MWLVHTNPSHASSPPARRRVDLCGLLYISDGHLRRPASRYQRGREEPHQDARAQGAFEADGFEYVTTYIQSGNVLFSSSGDRSAELTRRIEKMLAEAFDYVPTVV